MHFIVLQGWSMVFLESFPLSLFQGTCNLYDKDMTQVPPGAIPGCKKNGIRAAHGHRLASRTHHRTTRDSTLRPKALLK
jgi:hypothetical protein